MIDHLFLPRFVDFKKTRIQEVQAKPPRCCILRSVDIILRAEALKTPQPGDSCNFTAKLIVVRDVEALNLPWAQAESSNRHKCVKGLMSLGVRDLEYMMDFLACRMTTGSKNKLGYDCEEAESAEDGKEWEKNLYKNLITILFPTNHINDKVKRGIMLLLFGGVPKTNSGGTNLRGDINMCVLGNSSTANSQFLKMVSDLENQVCDNLVLSILNYSYHFRFPCAVDMCR